MSESEGDYLVQETDKSALKNLAGMGKHLRELKVAMVAAESVYDEAKKQYEYYANTVLPMEMYNLGLTSIELEDGGTITMERKFYCTPNKNEADKKIMADWLKAHGGEFLVKERAAIDAAQIPLLKETGIPFTEICDFNTNSLKAFLKDKLGASKGSSAQITVEDIPSQFHFQEQNAVSIDI